jgi:WD40 repeat protein
MQQVSVNRVLTFAGHRDCVYTLQPSNDNRQFFSAAGDGMIVKWDEQSSGKGEVVAKLPNSVYALHYLKERNLLIAGHNYDGLHVLDWERKKETGSLAFTKAPVFDIQSIPGRLYVATGDGFISCIDLENLVVIQKKKYSEKNARTISIHAERGELAVGYSDNFIRVLDLDTLSLKYEWQGHANSVFTLRYTPDGNILMSGSRDARIKAWDVKAGYLPVTEVVAHMYAINHLEFSPDGKHFVTCSLDKSIKVWDLQEFKLLKVIDKARHAGHGTSVNKLLWTADRLLSASDDRSISAWNIEFQDS